MRAADCDLVSRSGSCLPGWWADVTTLLVLGAPALVLLLLAAGKVGEWRAARRKR